MKAVALFALVLIGLSSPAALAQAAFDTKSAAAGTDVAITIAAPPDLGASNDRVTVDVPDGFRVLSCEHVDGFQCSSAKAVAPNRTVVAWQSVGPVRSVALRSDRFPFRMRTAATPGAYGFPVTQFYADGSAVRTEPTLEVKATGARSAAAPATTVVRPAAVRTLSATATTRAPQPRIAADEAVLGAEQVAASEPGRQPGANPVMFSLGVVATIAAAAVYWLRRRVAAIDP